MTVGQADQGGSILGEIHAGDAHLHVFSGVGHIQVELDRLLDIGLGPVCDRDVFMVPVHLDLRPSGSGHGHRRQHYQRKEQGKSSFQHDLVPPM